MAEQCGTQRGGAEQGGVGRSIQLSYCQQGDDHGTPYTLTYSYLTHSRLTHSCPHLTQTSHTPHTRLTQNSHKSHTCLTHSHLSHLHSHFSHSHFSRTHSILPGCCVVLYAGQVGTQRGGEANRRLDRPGVRSEAGRPGRGAGRGGGDLGRVGGGGN